jgi:hypothetical protein
MFAAFQIHPVNRCMPAIRAKLIDLLWLKGNLLHSSHLDFVRGRQATVIMM